MTDSRAMGQDGLFSWVMTKEKRAQRECEKPRDGLLD